MHTACQRFTVCPTHGEPYSSHNSALRGAEADSVSSCSRFSFLLHNALLKLPSVACSVYRGLNVALPEVWHLQWKGCFVWLLWRRWSRRDEEESMRQFGQGKGAAAGACMQLRVKNAKEIDMLSAVAGERQRRMPHNTCFQVLQVFSAVHVHDITAFCNPRPNVDLLLVQGAARCCVMRDAWLYGRLFAWSFGCIRILW